MKERKKEGREGKSNVLKILTEIVKSKLYLAGFPKVYLFRSGELQAKGQAKSIKEIILPNLFWNGK